MKNILKIIASDIHRLSINVVAIIVIIGLSVLPCLYAWFNIISNWDPYGPESTSNLQVAVASDDEGIMLGGLEVNIGEKIISNLEANTTIGWVFPETSNEAIDGVHSGDYYACLVIEEDFSKNLISFLGGDIENPKIVYYENEKKNAIAPKITGKVKTTIQREVDQAFISTLAGALLNASEAIVSVDSEGKITEASMQKLEKLDNDMKAVVMMLDSYLALMDASENLMTATESAAEAAGETMTSAKTMMEGADASVDSISTTVDTSNELVKTTLDNTMVAIEDTSKLSGIMLDVAILNAKALGNSLTAGFEDETNKLEDIVNRDTTPEEKAQAKAEWDKAEEDYKVANDAWLAAKDSEEYSTQQKIALREQRDAAYVAKEAARANYISKGGTLEEAGVGQSTTAGTLKKDFEALSKVSSKTADDASGIKKKVDDAISDSITDIRNTAAEYDNSVVPKMKATVQSAKKAVDETKLILNYDTSNFDKVAKSLDNYPNMMAQSRSSLQAARDEAAEMERKLALLTGNFDQISDDEQYDVIAAILNADSDYLADFIASPVNLSEEYIYPVNTNGSMTAPFYMVLSIWVGSLIMSTILKTKIKDTTGMVDLRNWQCFFGRYFTTFVIGQIQTVITVLGALLYVGIQCEHPFLLWLACSWTATVFSLLLYSFTYAFDNVGEALSVILMVIQVAGSGGTFPVEVLPKVFQYLYALMPFKYAMNACRECVAGFYKADYWIDLLCLVPFVALAIINGLFLYFPMRKLNHQIETSKERAGILI